MPSVRVILAVTATVAVHAPIFASSVPAAIVGETKPFVASPSVAEAVEARASAAANAPRGVAWLTDVSHALDVARSERKPIFVYFGALWCPPCDELKATIFRRKDFLDRLTLFVSVYVDGDAQNAQRWAERFHVLGYPTVLILRSDGSLIVRVSGGMDLSRYADVLDEGIEAVRPLQAILTSVSAGKRLCGDDCRILAYNAWEDDPQWTLENRAWLARTSDLLDRSAKACSSTAPLEGARLEIAAASIASESEAAALRAGKPPGASLAASVRRVYSLLQQDGTGDALIRLPKEFFVAAVRSDPASAQDLEQRFSKVMDGLAADPRYSVATQLYAVREKLMATQVLEPSGKIPSPIAEGSRQRVASELAKAHEPHSRASVVNAAVSIYHELGDYELAYQLFLAETETSRTPYYYMLDLAELEEKRGHKDRAVEWFARAYRESRGAATRILWGETYVSGLLRIRPDDEAAITGAMLQLIDDLKSADQFHGLTAISLEQLADELHGWNKDGHHAAAVAKIRAATSRLCRRIEPSAPGNRECGTVLAKI